MHKGLMRLWPHGPPALEFTFGSNSEPMASAFSYPEAQRWSLPPAGASRAGLRSPQTHGSLLLLLLGLIACLSFYLQVNHRKRRVMCSGRPVGRGRVESPHPAPSFPPWKLKAIPLWVKKFTMRRADPSTQKFPPPWQPHRIPQEQWPKNKGHSNQPLMTAFGGPEGSMEL